MARGGCGSKGMKLELMKPSNSIMPASSSARSKPIGPKERDKYFYLRASRTLKS